MAFQEKWIPFESIRVWRALKRSQGQTVVVTNGCFDLLHLGHVTYLEKARELGDCLLVGVNGDASVRALKGPSRPLNGERDRALVVAALESVGGVAVFQEVEATRFLTDAQPDIYVKGGDYRLDTLNQHERMAVEANGGRIVLIPAVAGKSTTQVVGKLKSSPQP